MLSMWITSGREEMCIVPRWNSDGVPEELPQDYDQEILEDGVV